MTDKSVLEAEIISGKIKTKKKLLERSVSLNLKITRNGRNYVGLLRPDGKRFRIRFNFSDGAMQLQKPPRSRFDFSEKAPQIKTKQLITSDTTNGPILRKYWVYALTAYSQNAEGKACYIDRKSVV